MNIIIVGCGKTGYTVARQLSANERNNVVIIDKRPLEQLAESLDVMLVRGNGISRSVLEEAGIGEADMLISVMPSDEANVVCALTAKLLGAQYTVARVCEPEYALELSAMRKELGVDLVINPDQQSALAISRLLRYPSAHDIETFANGYVEMVSFTLAEDDCLAGLSVEAAVAKYRTSVVFAMVNHGGRVVIPRGDSLLQAGDAVSILGRPGQITDFFAQTRKVVGKVKVVMVIGGGTISYYLARLLERHGIKTKIIEISAKRCDELSEALPESMIINGDGTDQELLHEENIHQMDAVLSLTDHDEENIVIGLYCRRLEIPKTVVKINHISRSMAANLQLGSVISPKILVAEQLANHVDWMINARGKNSNSVYRVGGTVEVLEFYAVSGARYLDTALKDLRLRRGVIIGAIIRRTKIITPVGATTIHEGDIVIVVTDDGSISDLDDILAEAK